MQYPVHELEAYFAGDCSDEQLRAVEAWINADPANARAFMEQLHFRELLGEHLREGRSDNRAILAELVRLEAAQQPEVVTLINLDDQARRQDKGLISASDLAAVTGYVLRNALTPKRLAYSGLAAAVLLGLTLAIVLQSGNTASSTEPTDLVQRPKDVQTPQRAVATLSAQHDAQWQAASGTVQPNMGQSLYAGQRLALTQGFAQITTHRGAVAILEAPCTVELMSVDNAIYLHAGKLVGVVESEQAKGFQVRTPYMDVRDLGTRFGVSSGSDATYLRVIEGEVHATSIDLLSDQTPTVLTAGQSAIVQLDQPALKRVDDAAERFVTSLQAVAGMPTLSGDIRYEPSMPSDLRIGAYENDKILLFPERSGVALKDAITVNLIESGRHQDEALQQPAVLKPTTPFDSYFVHFDTVGDDPSGLKFATITFDRPIVGVVTSSQALAQSHDALGLPGVLYGSMTPSRDAAFSGLDGTKEAVVISDDRRSLTLEISTSKGIDQVRVLVAHD